MFDFPTLQFQRNPEPVDGQRDDSKEEPLDPVPDQLSTPAVEAHPIALDDSMLDDPLPLIAVEPWEGDSQGKDSEEEQEKVDPDELDEAAIEIALGVR